MTGYLDARPAAWDRLPDETGRAYDAFTRYLDLPPRDRSAAAVARAGRYATGTCQGWASKHRWRERAAAWDADQRERLVENRRSTQVKATDNHALVAMLLLRNVTRELQALERNQENNKAADPKALSLLSQSVDRAIHHHRLALGLPTDHVRQDVELKQTIADALKSQERLRLLLEEHLCDDCRAVLAAELGRIADDQRRISERIVSP